MRRCISRDGLKPPPLLQTTNKVRCPVALLFSRLTTHVPTAKFCTHWPRASWGAQAEKPNGDGASMSDWTQCCRKIRSPPNSHRNATNWIVDLSQGPMHITSLYTMSRNEMKLKRTVLVSAALALACATALGAVNIAGITSAGDATMSQRLLRNGIASVCGSVKSYPGIFGTTGTYHYRTQTFQNSGPAQCVTITLDVSSCTTGGFQITAYKGAFDPLNLATNYAGDSGISSVSQTFSVDMAANSALTLVINETILSNPYPGCSYTLSSPQLSALASLTPASIPTLSEWALIGLSGAIALAGFAGMRRKT